VRWRSGQTPTWWFSAAAACEISLDAEDVYGDDLAAVCPYFFYDLREQKKRPFFTVSFFAFNFYSSTTPLPPYGEPDNRCTPASSSKYQQATYVLSLSQLR
jgi:hypothetical protein